MSKSKSPAGFQTVSALGSQISLGQNQVTGFWHLACTAVMCYIKTALSSPLFVGLSNSFSLNTAPPGAGGGSLCPLEVLTNTLSLK